MPPSFTATKVSCEILHDKLRHEKPTTPTMRPLLRLQFQARSRSSARSNPRSAQTTLQFDHRSCTNSFLPPDEAPYQMQFSRPSSHHIDDTEIGTHPVNTQLTLQIRLPTTTSLIRPRPSVSTGLKNNKGKEYETESKPITTTEIEL
ncbi:unnamed protein product [Vicia faba]|uniref:Uncharacterized protein n=1 Tax=Vicia faba TaxID=3906 RepID=A0AAV0YBM9_VICFA|nr:unnamed protein product [Vicia faba]